MQCKCKYNTNTHTHTNTHTNTTNIRIQHKYTYKYKYKYTYKYIQTHIQYKMQCKYTHTYNTNTMGPRAWLAPRDVRTGCAPPVTMLVTRSLCPTSLDRLQPPRFIDRQRWWRLRTQIQVSVRVRRICTMSGGAVVQTFLASPTGTAPGRNRFWLWKHSWKSRGHSSSR